MSANALTRVSATDDDGSGTTGTVLNDAFFQSIQAAVDSAIGQVVQTKSTTYTALVTDDLIICTAAMTVNLYAASGNSGRRITIKSTTTGSVTIDGNASETIDGSLTQVIDQQYMALTLQCDGSNWHLV